MRGRGGRWGVGALALGVGLAVVIGPGPRAAEEAAGAAAAGSSAEFELVVGSSVYDVRPDAPATIQTPAGEALEVVLRRKAALRFSGFGVQFTYPRDMTVSTEDLGGVTIITLECVESPLAILQVYRAPLPPMDVEQNLVSSLRKEFLARQGVVQQSEGTQTRRMIHGVEREGRLLEGVMAGEAFRTEVYAFPTGSRVLALVLQHQAFDAELAERYFSVITASLE